MASRSPTRINTIHIRDFVTGLINNPADPNRIQIKANINIFEENQFHTTDVIVEPIQTRIRAYLTAAEQKLYGPNTFFYAEGRFAAITSDDSLEITVQAFSLMRYVISNLSCLLPINTQADSGRFPLDTQVTSQISTAIADIYPNNGARWSLSSVQWESTPKQVSLNFTPQSTILLPLEQDTSPWSAFLRILSAGKMS